MSFEISLSQAEAMFSNFINNRIDFFNWDLYKKSFGLIIFIYITKPDLAFYENFCQKTINYIKTQCYHFTKKFTRDEYLDHPIMKSFFEEVSAELKQRKLQHNYFDHIYKIPFELCIILINSPRGAYQPTKGIISVPMDDIHAFHVILTEKIAEALEKMYNTIIDKFVDKQKIILHKKNILKESLSHEILNIFFKLKCVFFIKIKSHVPKNKKIINSGGLDNISIEAFVRNSPPCIKNIIFASEWKNADRFQLCMYLKHCKITFKRSQFLINQIISKKYVSGTPLKMTPSKARQSKHVKTYLLKYVYNKPNYIYPVSCKKSERCPFVYSNEDISNNFKVITRCKCCLTDMKKIGYQQNIWNTGKWSPNKYFTLAISYDSE